MMEPMAARLPAVLLERPALGRLIAALSERGYQVVGPRVRDGAIVYEPLEKLEDLPIGWGEEQEAGYYRLKKRDDEAVFGFNLGPQSWKKFLHPAELRILAVERSDGDFKIVEEGEPARRYAFFGVRPCELAAIAVQDRVLTGDQYVEPHYQARRQGLFLVAVQCTTAAPTCFCTSLGTGPRAEGGFDLALTELPGGAGLLAEIGSPRGAELLESVEHRPAGEAEREQAAQAIAGAASRIVRRLETRDIVRRLYEAYASPHWDEVARRCLACANCTMVCPTCFCTTVEDVSSVAGERAERRRKWDSCFTESFSYIHGGSVRTSVRSRYRQWLTHKLAAWMDQFDMFGCVGCGRCISWCPAKIDLTEEVKAVLASGG
jgi:sulfhydrogenase subunit beta (sulfur reductase)